MKRFLANWGRMATGAAALALIMGMASNARADFAYAFAEQTISNLRLTAQTGTLTPVAPNPTQTGTATGASTSGLPGVSFNDSTDALQSYVGTPAPPAQNTFTKFATLPGAPPVGPGVQPTTPTASFTRGDAAFQSATNLLFSTGVTVANVAESYLNNVVGQSSGVGGWSITASFTPTVTTVITASYNVTNDIYTSTGGNAAAQANFKFGLTVKNATGTTLFEVSPDEGNQQSGSPPNGVELVNTNVAVSGTSALAFVAGTTYSVTFAGSEQTFVSVASAIPAPASIVMLGLGFGTVGLVRFRNRRARA
jgi:hypothetical protein